MGSLVRSIALPDIAQIAAWCPADALLLQRALVKEAPSSWPAGELSARELRAVVAVLTREVVAEIDLAPGHWDSLVENWVGWVKDYAIVTPSGLITAALLPKRLRERQWVMACVADLLLHSPGQRKLMPRWSAHAIRRLARVQSWPQGALDWVSPEAGTLARQTQALRDQDLNSRQYLKACSALMAEVG